MRYTRPACLSPLQTVVTELKLTRSTLLCTAQRRQHTHNEPFNHGKVIGEALLVACVIGCLTCLAAARAENQDSGNGQPDIENQQSQQMPMPSMAQTPNMDWTPLQSEAQDGIQG